MPKNLNTNKKTYSGSWDGFRGFNPGLNISRKWPQCNWPRAK